jgi:hypothetical protein
MKGEMKKKQNKNSPEITFLDKQELLRARPQNIMKKRKMKLKGD